MARNASKVARIKLSGWFVINVVFALIPLVAQATVRWLHDLPAITHENVPDFAFLAVMLCVVTLGDLRKPPVSLADQDWLEIASLTLLVCALLGSITLGIYFDEIVTAPTSIQPLHRCFMLAEWIAFSVLLGTLCIEFFIIKASERG